MEHTEMAQDVCLEYSDKTKMNPRCLCDNTTCARHGNCMACLTFHKITDHDPTCKFAWHWKRGQEAELIERN